MKFNWGTAIVIYMAAFMIFILQYVIRVQTDSSLDNELYTEDYYQQEVEVDGKYQREKASRTLKNTMSIAPTREGILFSFPKEFDYSKISGKIALYRPSSQKLDFEIPISLSSSTMLIPKQNLVEGRWDVSVEWKYDGVNYRNTEELTLK